MLTDQNRLKSWNDGASLFATQWSRLANRSKQWVRWLWLITNPPGLRACCLALKLLQDTETQLHTNHAPMSIAPTAATVSNDYYGHRRLLGECSAQPRLTKLRVSTLLQLMPWLGYMWNKIISKLFQPLTTSVWNKISARGNLPEISSTLFQRL